MMTIEDIACELTLALSRRCPHATVRAAAVAAAFCRAARLDGAARWLAAWAYDVADCTTAAEPAFQTHREAMPWAWNHDRTLLAWWGRPA